MARSQTMVLTGNDAVNRKLAALKSSKAKSIIRKAAREALRPVLAAAKATAPTRSGRLKRSIRLRAITRSRSRVGARVTTGASDNAFSGKQYYGGFIEYGWRAGKRASNASVGASKFKRRAASQKAAAAQQNASRRQIPGKQWLKHAAESKREATLSTYRQQIEADLVDLAKETT